MGWIGWTEEQTLATDMQSIEAAYRGRHEMLQSLAGKEIAQAKIGSVGSSPELAMTPSLFVAMFGKKGG
jgi:hypothetical protein